ncbi:MAG: RnfABCDGE type electron transport complex subunit D [Planctomycetes bacterium]|nr:RnfABCDGE type electron transport complex subunit D [Planctomycetota bacterium]
MGAPRTRRRVDVEWLCVALVMLLSGLVFFGWRGVSQAVTTGLLALAGHLLLGVVVQTLKLRENHDPPLHAFVLGLLLGLTLPVVRQPWMPVLTGLLLAVSMHLVGRARMFRVSPVVLVLMLTWMLGVTTTGVADPQSRLSPFGPLDAVLRPDRVIVGDVRKAPEEYGRRPWKETRSVPEQPSDAIRRLEPARLILTEKQRLLSDPNQLVNMLISGELITIEDILRGATPGTVGASSRVLVIVLGLGLMYRRLAHKRVALWALGSATLTLWMMPVVVAEGQHSIVIARLVQMPLSVGVTFTGYMLLASPFLVTTLILAPMTAPISGAGRAIYGCLIGAVGVAAMWAFNIPQAMFLGLFVAGLLSKALDELHGGFPGRVT